MTPMTVGPPPSGKKLVLKHFQPHHYEALAEVFSPLEHEDTREILVDLPGLAIERWDLPEWEALEVVNRPHIIAVIDEGYGKKPPEPVLLSPLRVNMTIPEAVKFHGVDKLHNAGVKGRGSKIAVLDTGVSEAVYRRLASRITHVGSEFEGEDWRDQGPQSGHGTFCLEAVAACAPDAELVVIKVLSSQEGWGYSSGIIRGMAAAQSLGCTDISMSLGGPGNRTDAMCQMVDKLNNLGLLVYAAAGNEQRGQTKWMANESHPGCADGALCVGAVDSDYALASFSNWGDVLDLAALGMGIDYGGTIWNGTSMATPIVAGTGAAVRNNMRKGQEVRSVLYSGARDTDLETWREGHGVLDGAGILPKLGLKPPQGGEYHPNLPRVPVSRYLAGDRRMAVHTFRRQDIGYFEPKD